MKRNKISKTTCYWMQKIMDTRPGFWQQIEGTKKYVREYGSVMKRN